MKRIILLLICVISISARAQQAGPSPTLPLPDMVWVAGGSYAMGSDSDERYERPVHVVTVSDLYIAKYEVTQALWQAVMGTNPSAHKGCEQCPVEQITNQSTDEFIAKLNSLTGKKYRLPTEAEWEYAALGGSKTKGYRYPGSNDLSAVAWYKANAGDSTHPVGLLAPNELGLYDMAGNAWERCADWYDPAYYKKSPAQNPCNTTHAPFRLVRGGSWRSGPERCYCRARNRDVPDHHKGNGGLRLVLDK